MAMISRNTDIKGPYHGQNHAQYHVILISQQISYKMYMISYMICHENSARNGKIDMILYDIIQYHEKNHDIMYNIMNFFMISIAQETVN